MATYLLNNKNIETEYGFIVQSGFADFMKPAERKEPYSHDWQDDNGIEYDLSTPVFKNREFKLSGVLAGNNRADFSNKYNALITVLSGAGTQVIKVLELNKTFNVFYKNATTDMIAGMPIKDITAIKLTITLQEVL